MKTRKAEMCYCQKVEGRQHNPAVYAGPVQPSHTPTPIESLKDALKPMTKEDEFKKVIPLMPISLEVTQCARTIICNCLGEAWKWETQDEYERQVNLFAAFIVRAVNAHEEMLEALYEVRSFILDQKCTGKGLLIEAHLSKAIARAEGK